MPPPSPRFSRLGYSLSLLILSLTIIGCASFPKGVKLLLDKQEVSKAKPKFERSRGHKVYDPGARFYLDRIAINQSKNTVAWIKIHENFCALEEEIGGLPIKQIKKLNRHRAGRQEIRTARRNLRERIVEDFSRRGSITQLIALEENSSRWPDRTLETLRKIIVNKSIDPKQVVFNNTLDQEWEGRAVKLPTVEEIEQEAGRSCRAFEFGYKWNLTYEEVRALAHRYEHVVLPANLSTYWEIQRDAWDIFQVHESYCNMDQFKVDFPITATAQDCWFDSAKEALCASQLKPLLAFHRDNPHTVLDPDICRQVLCIANFAEDAKALNADEQKQLEDITLMYDLQAQLLQCNLKLDSSAFINQVAYLAKDYPHHRVVFDLAVSTLDFFAGQYRFKAARLGLEQLQPLFPDTSSCKTDFYFQTEKQSWFKLFGSLLKKAETEQNFPEALDAFNTITHDEYALVSWGETDEVFFVRRNRQNRMAQVMTSIKQEEEWSQPIRVEKLSFADDVIPLSISSGGRQMLLKSGGRLYTSTRIAIGRPWTTPEVFPMKPPFAGSAWISPDDSLMLVEYYSERRHPREVPKIDIATSDLGEDGVYHHPMSVGTKINRVRSYEQNPVMALQGRMLIYTSNQVGSLGGKDVYSIVLRNPRDWTSLEEPVNLGLMLNSYFHDPGVSYFSEYSGKAYFHRRNRCTNNFDIWRVKLGPGVFPANALRLAGVILDENHKPIGKGGFVEFTPNYELNVHAQPVSIKGTYSYTVADSTEVVRVFPEVPGYYSERDTTHYLSDTKRGEIIRDTFILTSFDYIRKNFKLENSTFFNGKAEFDRPEKAFPEITRLAEIATRMGADLELHGHTDNTGTEKENLDLSIQRANAIKAFLTDVWFCRRSNPCDRSWR
ncbi:MAG: OmpA family protein [Saprospiraceae bacterium]|nr:OmpA family protein [Saprospiraceae bacterium]